jgi:hypothetical protein
MVFIVFKNLVVSGGPLSTLKIESPIAKLGNLKIGEPVQRGL